MKPVNKVLPDKSIAHICQKYNAKYIMDSCLKTVDGQWANFPAAFFYTEKAHPEGSNYFALYRDEDRGWLITDGIRITEGVHNGFLFDDGELVHSRYRHDYYEYRGVVVDGGRDYFRTSIEEYSIAAGAKRIKFKVVGPDLIPCVA
jgi:hypothetical protein